MVVEPRQQEAQPGESHGVSGIALAAFAEVSRALAEGETLQDALETIVGAAARLTASDVVVLRVLDDAGAELRARAVWAASAALTAELEGTRFPITELPPLEASELPEVPAAVRRDAERAGAHAVLQIPISVADRPLGSLELFRASKRFTDDERALARLLASHAGLAVRAFGQDARELEAAAADDLLERAGNALAAGADHASAAEAVVQVAAEATGAAGAFLWRSGEGDTLELVAAAGLSDGADSGPAAHAAAAALLRMEPIVVDAEVDGLPADAAVSATLELGQPPLGALQLLFPADASPAPATLSRLATFGVRAAHALRATERARRVALELERTRALLGVVGEAIAHLSLAHTLETAVERVGELVGADRLAVYLREEDGRLMSAAGLGLAGPHVRVAERVLELALGSPRGRGLLVLDPAAGDPRLHTVQDAVSEAGLEAVIALPLLAHEEPIGLLALYPSRGRALTQNEAALLSALASQLAVAVQNARLHERAVRAESEAKQALSSEKQAASRLRALYEISRSFAQSLSLEKTLDAVAGTIVETLGVDAAVVRMADERREELVVRKLHVADPRLHHAVAALVARPQKLARLPGRRLFRMGRPLVLDAAGAAAMGASYELLVPFLEKGSTAAVIPVKTSTEVLATLTLLSLDPGRPIDDEAIATALAIAGQSALALDNARLYEQQKDFADTIQRSLLPRSAPTTPPGLELGAVYASSAHLDVGGDVYDFLELPDGRLAVVLGDVTGHGIEATADMAMAKFVFRSLAREHPEPSDFLAHANDVVVDEVELGKFITMLYLTVDAMGGAVACAGAGHPAPRIVDAKGNVRPLEARGLALGIEPGQEYEEAHERLAPGSSVVLYTDGVVEARLDRELFGLERLDEVLGRKRHLPPEELAQAVLGECRAFAGGDLADDCAVVVIRRGLASPAGDPSRPAEPGSGAA